ncbi:MAG TPA: MerR family transcriptional regulator [Polyangiaceae bacterium]|nr:MerR family transcriptional regulator [Polyangiaceae bacterium]
MSRGSDDGHRGSSGGAQLEKLYYRIGEVSSIVGVEPHVLRYWESEFRSVRPQKSARGQRIYSRRDVETLLKVKELLYAHRFTIAGARRRLRDGGVEPPPKEAVGSLEDLTRIREALVGVREEMVALLADVDSWGDAALDDAAAAPDDGDGRVPSRAPDAERAPAAKRSVDHGADNKATRANG